MQNSVTFINKKDVARIFRVTVVLKKCFEKVLKDYTVKLLYQRLGKYLNIIHLHVLYKLNILKKIKKERNKENIEKYHFGALLH